MRSIAVCAVALSLTFASALAVAEPSHLEVAQSILADLAKQGDAAKPAEHEIANANAALERARSARAAGDAKHAVALEGVARTWAETARDVLVAVKAEADLAAADQALTAARTQMERDRALLEETLSRRGLATVELSRAEEEARARTPKDVAKKKKVSATGAVEGDKKPGKKK